MECATQRFSNGSGGHSALVQIRLLVEGTTFDVSQIGGGRLTFSNPVTLPGTHGVVVLSIDGHEERWSVTIKPMPQPTKEVEAEFRLLEGVIAGAA